MHPQGIAVFKLLQDYQRRGGQIHLVDVPCEEWAYYLWYSDHYRNQGLKDLYFQKRNSVMADNIAATLRRFPGEKGCAIVGTAHLVGTEDRDSVQSLLLGRHGIASNSLAIYAFDKAHVDPRDNARLAAQFLESEVAPDQEEAFRLTLSFNRGGADEVLQLAAEGGYDRPEALLVGQKIDPFLDAFSSHQEVISGTLFAMSDIEALYAARQDAMVPAAC